MTSIPSSDDTLMTARLPSSAPAAASSAPSPVPSENDIDVAGEEAAIDAAISQAQQEDNDDHQTHTNGTAHTAASPSAPDAMDELPPLSPAASDGDVDYEPPAASAAAAAAAPSSASKSRKRSTPAPRPPPPDPSIARATGAKLLDELLAKAAAYMSRTAVGADLAPAVSTSKKHRAKAKGRMSEKEEDDVMLHSLADEADSAPTYYPPLTEQPANITGKMRAYQLEGLNWMIRLYDAGVSGILADEMGLGKTLQSISLLAYLKGVRNVRGPHLVLTPLSTLGNWHREFGRWCPELRVLRFHGTREERAEMIARGDLNMQDYDILLTSYEMAIREKNQINRTQWCFIIIDEAHRLKNENSLLSVIVRYFSSRYRLLLTGTPLQNNLHELWALLNFLLPDLFSSSNEFDAIFQDAETDNSDRGATLLQSLHRLLRPFMLRRMKQQVETDLPPKKTSLIYTGLSDIQRKLYKQILEKDVEALMGTIKERSRLMNMVMQLRKVADHPFLFDGVEEPGAPLHGEHLITVSGKMRVLDKLLAYLKQRGSRVLIFSQMTRMLDILEDYLITRGHLYNRIDGNTPQADREEHMRVFNEEGSPKFCFLLSTRAGGLGINLVTADTVILYDSDWSNPQMDLQAMDRAHRIGQKKEVNVLRLVCEDTVEVQMLKRAEIKLHLDAMVIQQGKVQGAGDKGKQAKGGMTTEDLTKMIRYGADKIFRQTESTITEEDISNILSRGEQNAKEMDSSLKQHVTLHALTLDGHMEDNLLPADPGTELNLTPEELELHRVTMVNEALGKRQRKQNYNEDEYYREVLKVGGRLVRTLLHKPFRVPRMSEHQFFDRRRIEELSDKEVKFYHRFYHSLQPPALRGLSDAEAEELQELIAAGYEEWSFVDYQRFLKALRRYGRHQMDKIAAAMAGRGKTREQVESYHQAFFSHVDNMKGGPALLQRIERAERRQAKFAEMEELLDRLLTTTPAPTAANPTPTATPIDRHTALATLQLRYTSGLRDRGYTLEEDRYLLWLCREVGFGEWSRMCRRMESDEQFDFDWYILARSPVEIERRVTTLLKEIQRHTQPDGGKKARSDRKVDGAEVKVDVKADVDSKGGQKRKAEPISEPSSKAVKKDRRR